MKKLFPALSVLACILSACTSSPSTTDRHVFVVRHAEKCTLPADDPPLTPAGRQRSQDLIGALATEDIGAVYSTPFVRTLETVTPIAEERGLDIIRTPMFSGFVQALADTARASTENGILVSGHSNTVARLVNVLVGTDYPDLDESVYDLLYVVTLRADSTERVEVRTYGGPSMGVADCRNRSQEPQLAPGLSVETGPV